MKPLLLLLFSMFSVGISAQVIYDFETPETSNTFIYFGSTLDTQPTVILNNPNPTGINTSTIVSSFTKGIDAEDWSGAYANTPQPMIDATSGGQICVDVHMDHVGNLALKLEQSTDGGKDWITVQQNTAIGEWETLCYNLSDLSIEGDPEAASGFNYNQLVMFFDFGVRGTTEEVTSYFDNITFVPTKQEVTIFDFETPETSTDFTYFGSTLEPGTAAIIDNPNATGVNTSPKVSHYIKAANSQTWAGAYCAPKPVIDATNGGQICVDVHMDHIGNLGLKLEESSTASNWVTVVGNTKINEWETLCFDLSANGLEDAMTPAAGHIFNQMVIFPDFGTAFDFDQNYYVDNFRLITSAVTEESEITFSVDMNGSGETFTQVYLSGQFNDWSGDANPMDDSDGDNIWTTTLTLKNGQYEYKYNLDNWASSEQFDGNDVCTISTDDGNGTIFTNRLIRVAEDATVATCYASCYACGAALNITWNVNMTNETISPEGVFLAGGPFFGHGDFPLSDDDGDGIYTITIEREKGFASDYVFINGICLPDWGCKEQLAGQDCAVQPFNDRNIVTGEDDVVINTCFGECSTDGSCSGGPQKYMATFNVDMSSQTVAGGVFLSGQLINGWSADATPMDDTDGDGIYSVTVELGAGIVEYKFVNGSAYEEFSEEGPCNITDPSGQFINRLLLMEEKDTVLGAYVFETCDISTNTNDLVFDETLFTVVPTVTSDFVNVKWSETGDKTLRVYSVNGQLMSEVAINANEREYTLDVQAFAKGLYLINLTTDTKVGLKKMIVD